MGRQRLLLGLMVAFGLGVPVQADPVMSCQDLSDPVAAVSACGQAIAGGAWQGQDLAWAHNNRGLAHAAQGDLLAAIKDYDRAIELAPGYAPAYSNRGNARAVLGDMIRAHEDHEKALALDPGYVAAWHNRGVDREELGRYRDALEDYRKVISMAPDHRGSHIGLATANCKLGRVKASAEARLRAIEKGLLDATDMQLLLQAEGHYKGAIDGIFGKGSRAALWAWTRKGCLAGA